MKLFFIVLLICAALTACDNSAQRETVISVEFANDELLRQYDSYEEFIEVEEYERLIFRTNKAVKNFRFIEIGFTEEPEFKLFENLVLYSIDKFTPEMPFVVTWRDQGDVIPQRGISFTDENNTERYFYLRLSGEDGSLMLIEFKPQ